MLGEDSDGEEEADTTEGKRDVQDDEMGCTWGMGKTLPTSSEFLANGAFKCF